MYSSETDSINREMISDGKIEIRCLSDYDDKTCNDYVEQETNASVFHLPKWCELIAKVFAHETYYFYAKDASGLVTGVLPLVRLKSRLFGDYMVSMPYFNYGGAIGLNDQVEQSLMHKAVELGKNLGVSHIEFRSDRQKPGDWQVRTDKVNMLLDLPANPEILWKALGAKRRSQIKRPIREGVEVQIGGVELVNDYYQVFSRNMRDLGTPVYAKTFFIEILNTFPELSKIVLVHIKGTPAGAAFLVGFRNFLEIPWASTVSDYNKFGINMFMYWEVLKFAIENGYKTFDFGRSTIDSGTYKFKKQWGAQPKQLYWHYWLRDGKNIPQLTPNNPKYQLAIKTWQRFPIFFANWLGPKIVKNLP